MTMKDFKTKLNLFFNNQFNVDFSRFVTFLFLFKKKGAFYAAENGSK